MKLLNKKQKNNKGFSLVELIVVIAIMVVLVAVLAPVFTKYIESSRRSTDVQNANSIAEAVLADVADGKISGDKTAVVQEGDGGYVPTAIAKVPQTKGNVTGIGKDAYFKFVYTKADNVCKVYAGSDTTYNLAEEGTPKEGNKDGTGAQGYKDAD